MGVAFGCRGGATQKCRKARLLPIFLVAMIGCAAEPPVSTEAEFQDAVTELQREYGGEGKADIFGIDVCDALSPVLSGTDASIRSGFFIGVSGTAALSGLAGVGGFDVVFDLYHHQMTVSRYVGGGVALTPASSSVQVYAGFATGFEDGVADWNGHFVTATLSLSLPFVRELASLTPWVFVTGEDDDSDGFIAPDEVVVPPDGIYGFGVGVTVGFDVPTGLPISGSLVEGRWDPHPDAIRWYYDRLHETRFAGIGSPLAVRLVDRDTREECPADWPAADAERRCIIEFGEPEWSHTRRSLHMAYGICTASGGCAVPVAWPMSAASIAVGAIRDLDDDLSARCPELATP
jgi:hypothetical protein